MYGGHVLNIVKTFSIDLSVIESTRIYACIIGYSQFAGPMFGKLSLPSRTQPLREATCSVEEPLTSRKREQL